MRTAIYNEIEPFAAAWMRELIAQGHIAPGVVDERSIADLEESDIAGPGQRHFFAGIGGWSYALRLAGVPDDADIWTGSCPCQPFSQAGKGLGLRDPRHLWPTWFALIEQRRPSVIFGEQIAGADGLAWLDLVFADLERCDYSVGAANLSAAGVGAPHKRQRLYFVAYADDCDGGQRVLVPSRQSQREVPDAHGRGEVGILAAAAGSRRQGHGSEPRGELGDADSLSAGRLSGSLPRAQESSWSGRGDHGPGDAVPHVDPWRDFRWIDCSDGKRRPIPTEPALFPLADGVPNRVGLLRGSGNAICTATAATFIRAALEAMKESTRV